MDNGKGLRARLRTWRQYSPLRQKIFWQILGLLAGSMVFLFFVHNQLPRGIIAEAGVWVLQRALRLKYASAERMYNEIVYGYYNYIMLACVLLVFLGFFWFALGWFMRYFNEIERGLDTLLAGDGQPVTLSPYLHPLEQKFNTVRETLERRRQESRLAEQRKNDLVMYLAHDIRTPLTSVIGYLSLLEEAPEMPMEQRARYTGIALQKAQRLETLVNEFFEITRYNLQEMPLQWQHFDLHYLLVQLADEFWPALQARGCTLRLDAPETLTAYGDPDKLARVFNNLLKNAVAYGYPGSEILLTAAMRDGTAAVTVQSHGPTIPPQRLDAIFERFYRLDSARGTDSGGAGLGLAIAKEIVARHGGHITARSADEVTVFTVTLPQADTPPNTEKS